MASAESGEKQATEKKLTSGLSPDIGKATQFKPGQSGNPAGKPKGTLHLSTHIQRMLNDDDFVASLPQPGGGIKHVKGRPIEAIIATAVVRAMRGEKESREWLAKYGYGTKVELSGPDGGPVIALVEFVDHGDQGSD